MLSFDTVNEEIVGTGWYVYFLTGMGLLINMASAGVMTAAVFLAGFPQSRCYVTPYDNLTLYSNLTGNLIETTFVPWNNVTKGADRCHRNVIDDSWCTDNISVYTCLNSSKVVGSTGCTDGYIYDKSYFDETVITEWGLACEKYSLISFSNSLFFVGVAIGSLVGGIMSDRFGRILTCRCGIGFGLLIGVAVSFSPNILSFSFLRALEVVLTFHAVVAGYTYMSEISPPPWRLTVTLLFNTSFGIGCCILSVFAFYWRKWRELQLVCTLIMFIPCFLYTFMVPKSPRWLFGHGNFIQSEKVSKSIAKKSGSIFPQKVWKSLVNKFQHENEMVTSKKVNTVKEIFRRPHSRFLIICNMFVWFVTSLVYYGLTLNSGSLAGDPIINNALGGVMEALACIVDIFFITKFGSVKSEITSLSLAGFACLASTAVVEVAKDNYGLQIFGTVLALIGRFGASMCFGAIYHHTVQMFPTNGRTTALGLSSMSGRIGTIITPWTIQLQYSVPWLTQTIFGVIALAGAVTAAFLVETKDQKLIMTFPEAERFYCEKMQDTFTQKFFKLQNLRQEDGEEKETLGINEHESVA